MLGKPIDAKLVRVVYGYMDSKNHKISRSFEVLAKNGYVDVVGPNQIQINDLGRQQVYKMANTSRRVYDD